jgi:hypothetical protein
MIAGADSEWETFVRDERDPFHGQNMKLTADHTLTALYVLLFVAHTCTYGLAIN